MDVTSQISIPSDSGYFEGHFPGRPILPGVAQLALMLEALERETEEPVPLRGIGFTRLRQLVLPGESLVLTAKTVDEGRLRITLKRDDTLITNGEFLLGPLDSSDNETLSTMQFAAPLSGIPPMDELLPHRAPMQFIQSVVHEAADSIVCMASIPSVCALVNKDSVPAVVGLEAAAQAAAAWEALQRQRVGGSTTPRVGYLVALRETAFFVGRIPADTPLLVKVDLEAAAAPLSYYRIALYLDGKPLAKGTIATFLKQDDA